MKVAILSDIHGNLPALQAVTIDIEKWSADEVIVNGDIVNRGPKPLACWSFVQGKRRDAGWRITRGNHEDYVIKHARAVPDAEHVGIRAEINKSSLWTYQQLNGSVADLAALPDVVSLFGDSKNGRFPKNGIELRATHASMRGNQDCIWPAQHTVCPTSTAEQVRQQIGTSPPALFVTSHIHLAHKRQIGETTVINTGSAGNHCYGDSRATYVQAVFQNGKWNADIVRVPYDMAQTERDYHVSGFLTDVGAGGRLLYYEWKTAVPILTAWRRHYEGDVLAGRMGLETAVSQFLTEQGMI